MAKEDNIGALWIKNNNGNVSMSGYVEIDGKRTNLVCFTNGYKKEDKHPDWNILISKPQSRDEAQAEVNNPNPEMQPEPTHVEGVTEEDIPW